MKKENTKFYILVVCSIIIYITSFLSNSNSASPALAIIFMAISAGKTSDTMLSKISKVLVVLMTIGFFYSTFLRNS